MDRIDKILHNDDYRKLVMQIEEDEMERIYCHHDMSHFLDVARIATLMAEDESIEIKRDMIYAAALLHDIGRHEQYENSISHEIASADMAPSILEKCGFSNEETDQIVEAIRCHGDISIKDERDLRGILFRADKASRRCYMCKAADKCHKIEKLRVKNIDY